MELYENPKSTTMDGRLLHRRTRSSEQSIFQGASLVTIPHHMTRNIRNCRLLIRRSARRFECVSPIQIDSLLQCETSPCIISTEYIYMLARLM